MKNLRKQKHCRHGKPASTAERFSGRRSEAERLLLNHEGSSLVLVLCFMMVMVVLCGALLTGASLLIGAVHRERAKEQCRIMAMTMSRCLEQELTERDYEWTEEMPLQENSLHEYVGRELFALESSWPDWDPQEEPDGSAAGRTFCLSPEEAGWPKEAGTVTVCLYWTREPMGETDIPEEPSDPLILSEEEELPWSTELLASDAVLYVETTCTLRKQSWTVAKQYEKQVVWEETRIPETEPEDSLEEEPEETNENCSAEEAEELIESGTEDEFRVVWRWRSRTERGGS